VQWQNGDPETQAGRNGGSSEGAERCEERTVKRQQQNGNPVVNVPERNAANGKNPTVER